MRLSSSSAREGTRTCCPSARTEVPGRSRTESRYESVATSRSPPASAASSTPVRIGRASSELAAGTTCLSASASSPAFKVSGSPATSARRGYSSAGSTRIANSERPEVMWASSSSTTTTTAPAGRARTISPARRPGRTLTPSSSPLTLTDTWMVRSESLPVSCSEPALSSARMPDSTGIDPPRVEIARPALPRASTRTSRSHRNFTAALFLDDLFRGRGSRACGLWMNSGSSRSGGVRLPARHPQRRTGLQPRVRTPWDNLRSSTEQTPVVHRRFHRRSSRCARSCPALDELGELVHLVVDLALLAHQLLDLLDRVDDRGVVALAEGPGDGGVAEVGDLTAHVHGDLAGVDERPGAARGEQLTLGEAEHLRGGREDDLGRDDPRLAVAQEVAEHPLRQLE